MALNFRKPGHTLLAVAPTGGVTAGTLYVLGTNVFGVASTTAVAGAEFELAVEGVFELPKHSATTSADLAFGAIVYWDVADGEVNATSSGNTKIGVCVTPAGAASADTTCYVRLNGVFG